MKAKSMYGLLAFLNWNHDWNDWHFPDELVKKAALQIRELGVDIVRTDIVWSDIHTGLHQYDFTRYDRLMSQLSAYGIKLLAVLHYNKFRLDDQGKEIWNHPPESFQEFARYVESTVRRYKHHVRYWEIWNEPNHPEYWNAPSDNLKSYCELLKLSYDAAKNVDPSCLVLNGGITASVVPDVKSFYESGGRDITDRLNIHTFFDPTAPDATQQFDRTIEGVRDVMHAHGDDSKKIWITEMGCPGLGSAHSTKEWWIGVNTSETQQAQWLETIYLLARRHPSIEKLFWAFYRDTGEFFKNGVDYFGLVRKDFTPKPAFYRLKTLIDAAS